MTVHVQTHLPTDPDPSPRCTVTGAFTNLCFHALAWIATRDPSSLRDVRYLAWARSHLPADAVEPFDDDAPILSLHYERALPASRVLHGFCALYDGIEAFLATAARSWTDARTAPDAPVARAVSSPFDALEPALLELFRCDLALAARAYERAFETVIAPSLADGRDAVATACSALSVHVPWFRTARIEVIHALGARGRVIGESIFVGVPAPWNDATPERIAIQALHECAVRAASRRSPARGYVAIEWQALCATAAAMHGADGAHGVFARVYAQWLGALSLDALAHGAVKGGLTSQHEAREVIEADGDGRWKAFVHIAQRRAIDPSGEQR